MERPPFSSNQEYYYYSWVPNYQACSNHLYFGKNHPGRGLLGTAQLNIFIILKDFLQKITGYVKKLFSYVVKCIQTFCFIALWSIIRPCSIKFLRYFYTMVVYQGLLDNQEPESRLTSHNFPIYDSISIGRPLLYSKNGRRCIVRAGILYYFTALNKN